MPKASREKSGTGTLRRGRTNAPPVPSLGPDTPNSRASQALDMPTLTSQNQRLNDQAHPPYTHLYPISALEVQTNPYLEEPSSDQVRSNPTSEGTSFGIGVPMLHQNSLQRQALQPPQHIWPLDYQGENPQLYTSALPFGHLVNLDTTYPHHVSPEMQGALSYSSVPPSPIRAVPPMVSVHAYESTGIALERNPAVVTGPLREEPLMGRPSAFVQPLRVGPTSQPFTPAHISIIFNNSTLSASRDINVNVNMDAPILHKLKNLLKPVNAAYDSYEADQRSNCFENTRIQVLADIEDWISGRGSQAPVYVLDGVAGIGKSTVAQTIAEQADRLGILGASFFFTRNEEERTTARYFFPTIAFQLACRLEQFALQLTGALDENPTAPQKLLGEQLSLLILDPLRAASLESGCKILIIIDALDECVERDGKELLHLIVHYIQQLPWLKVFIAARPEWHIRGVLENDSHHALFRLHEIEKVVVYSDIRLYLEASLSVEHVKRLFPHRDPPWQATSRQMEILCGMCGTLFIIASTVIKFILDNKRSNPGQQLARLLDGVSPETFSGSKHTDVMDKVYMRIIKSAAPDDLDNDSDDWVITYQTVIGAIITLATPLPCSDLASLLGLNRADLSGILLHLHSLVAPSGPDQIFRVHHKSFPDFITSRDRIQKALESSEESSMVSRFHIKAPVSHRDITKQCFRVMNDYLKRNIADLEANCWYKDKTDIPQLGGWCPPGQVAYAVQYWSFHLQEAGQLDQETSLALTDWSKYHILAWLEVLCILELLYLAEGILETAIRVLRSPEMSIAWTELTKVIDILQDALKHVLQTRKVLSISPMHSYWSGLAFIPSTSKLHDFHKMEYRVQVLSGLEDEWNPVLATLTDHSSYVGVVKFSPDGMRLASGSVDETVRLWDGITGDPLCVLRGHSDLIHTLCFTPDGSKLASASFDKTIRMWDVITGEHIATLGGHSDGILALGFHPDSSRLVSSSGQTVQIWESVKGKNIGTLTGHSASVTQVLFSPDGSRIASGSGDTTIRLWDTMTGQPGSLYTICSGHQKAVKSIAFSPDGQFLASGAADAKICLWDARTGNHIVTLCQHSKEIRVVLFSPDGSKLASGSCDQQVCLWNGQTGDHLATIDGLSEFIQCLVFSHDSSKIIFGSHGGQIKSWSSITGDYLATLTGHSDLVRCLALSYDGMRLASASNDKTVRLWNARMLEYPQPQHNHRYQFGLLVAIGLSHNGSKIAIGCYNGSIVIEHVSSEIGTSILKGHCKPIQALTFSSNDSMLASCSRDTTVQLWETGTGSSIFVFKGHSSWVNDVRFSSDNLKLVSAGSDHTACIWDTHNGALLTTIKYPDSVRAISFAFGGSSLAAAYDRKVRLCNPLTGTLIKHLTSRRRNTSTALVSSPDGSYLASIDGTNDIQIWNAEYECYKISFSQIKSIIMFAFIPEKTNQGDPVPAVKPVQAIMAVQRKNPPLFGLVAMQLQPDWSYETAPFFWFPPGFLISMCSFDYGCSTVAVVCTDNRLVKLDISKVILPF